MQSSNSTTCKESLAKVSEFYNVKMINKYNTHYYTSDTVPEKTSYPSVTSILGTLNKGGLMGWHDRVALEYVAKQLQAGVPDTAPKVYHMFEDALKESDRVRDASAVTGTRIHAVIEAYINFQIAVNNSRTADAPAAAYDNYCELVQGSSVKELDHTEYAMRVLDGYKPLAAEYMVFNEIDNYGGPGTGGSIDAVMWEPEQGIHCFDWKTGSNIYDTHKIQIATYATILQTMIERVTKIHMPITCHVCATGKRETVTIDSGDVATWYDKFEGIARAWDATHKAVIFND